MTFRFTIIIAAVILLLIDTESTSAQSSQTVVRNEIAQTQQKKPTLAEQLRDGLRTRRPQDLKFITMVVERVNAKTLPLELVRSTFAYARKKPRRQFQYFRFALIARAKEKGIILQ